MRSILIQRHLRALKLSKYFKSHCLSSYLSSISQPCGSINYYSKFHFQPTYVQFNRNSSKFSSSESNEEDLVGVYPNSEYEFSKEEFGQQPQRTELYPNASDPHLQLIFSAGSVNEIFSIIKEIPEELFNHQHASQALIALWELQKLYFWIGPYFDPERDFTSRQSFINQLNAEPTFHVILHKLTSNLKSIDNRVLVLCLYCLFKLEFDLLKCPIVGSLLSESLTRSFSLHEISRLFVILKHEHLYGSLFLSSFSPSLHYHIGQIDGNEGLYLSSICLRSTTRHLSDSTINLYRLRLHAILSSESTCKTLEAGTLCKVLGTLAATKLVENEHRDKFSVLSLQQRVSSLLNPLVSTLDIVDILSLQRFLESSSLEPSYLINSLQKRINRLLEEQKENPRLDLLASFSHFSKGTIEQRKRLGAYMSSYLDSYAKFEQIYTLSYKILKGLKLYDRALYDKFWNKVLLEVSTEANDPRKILKFASDYNSFIIGTNHSYYNHKLENKLKTIFYFYLNNYQTQKLPSLLNPSDFARMYAFLVSFSSSGDPILEEKRYGLIKLFKNFLPQCYLTDLIYLGRGVLTALNLSSKTHQFSSSFIQNAKFNETVLGFSEILQKEAERRLNEESDLSPHHLVLISKLYSILRRTSTTESPTLQSSISKLVEGGGVKLREDLDSKLGKDIAVIHQSLSYNEPLVTQSFVDFILKNGENISTEFAEKFLTYAFNIGYEPQSEEEASVFKICGNLIESEKNLSASHLSSCLALSYYQALSDSLVHRIFSVDFLNEVDEEIQASTSSSKYALKLRTLFMELNRSVCLDMPSSKVPWFHQKFCESVHSSRNIRESSIETEVFESLGEVLTDSSSIQMNVFSPYFYKIKYLIEFDKEGKPIKRKKKTSSSLLYLHNLASSVISKQNREFRGEVGERVAINILPHRAFTNNIKSLRGYYLLQKRHLEMLGYRLIYIDPQVWNSMYMSEPLAKNNYIEQCIFGKCSSEKRGTNLKKSSNNQSIKLNLV